MAKVETLIDAFNGTSLNKQWTPFTAGNATLTYASTGASCVFPASTTSSTDGEVDSATTYDLTNSYARLQVTSTATSASGCDSQLRLQTASNNYIRWVVESGTLFAQYDVAGSKSTPFSVAYSATTHLWWRIREGTGDGAGGSAGTVYWDTSADGVTWTNRASVADPITITALTVLMAGIGNGTVSNPGTFTWSLFNTYTVPTIGSFLITSI